MFLCSLLIPPLDFEVHKSWLFSSHSGILKKKKEKKIQFYISESLRGKRGKKKSNYSF